MEIARLRRPLEKWWFILGCERNREFGPARLEEPFAGDLWRHRLEPGSSPAPRRGRKLSTSRDELGSSWSQCRWYSLWPSFRSLSNSMWSPAGRYSRAPLLLQASFTYFMV